ncbi:MAG TPA: hypothetical protein VEX86_11600 [Longimicrobium sp.]|nr:hypothetical protein [Longimicrobium sp.]
MTARLEILVESRRIEALPAADEEVASAWEKALRTLRSSRLEGLDVEPAFTLAYQSALQCCAAVLRAAGYRAIGRDHHHSIFAGVAALEAGELSRIARAADDMRVERHEAVYGSTVAIDHAQLEEMYDVAARMFAAAHAWLRAARPALDVAPPPAPER